MEYDKSYRIKVTRGQDVINSTLAQVSCKEDLRENVDLQLNGNVFQDKKEEVYRKKKC